ncbi:up-regulator of cell proliferation-like isoform X6 [Gouania willdenowi]|uniref:up-regulator of cell proliferation-like isoform X6 n=1 Tax=Gouania willdenowi TaxID=441366 RepID=UPI001056760B|nr:up-regulator of cell proliferation-like isoform X6 [Gouania willdenowi]
MDSPPPTTEQSSTDCCQGHQTDPPGPQSSTDDTNIQQNTTNGNDKGQRDSPPPTTEQKGRNAGNCSADICQGDQTDPPGPQSSTDDTNSQQNTTNERDKGQMDFSSSKTEQGSNAGDCAANRCQGDQMKGSQSLTDDTNSQENTTNGRDKGQMDISPPTTEQKGINAGNCSADICQGDQTDPPGPQSSTDDTNSQQNTTNGRDKGQMDSPPPTTEQSSTDCCQGDQTNPPGPQSSTDDTKSQQNTNGNDKGQRNSHLPTTEQSSTDCCQGDQTDPPGPQSSTDDSNSQQNTTNAGKDNRQMDFSSFETERGSNAGDCAANRCQGDQMKGSQSLTDDTNSQENTTNEINLESFLKDLGLEQHYRKKLSLQNILQIDKKTIDDEPAKCKSHLPWHFLKKLMMVNVTARNVKYDSDKNSNDDGMSENTELDFNDLFDVANSEDMVNPLDVITALFLCSDGFVQQQMALKMSMCQFPVPLLLPSCDSQQCTLMLWAMRDIVKQYRPEALSESKDFTEERIVLSNLPMVSFVRLGECSLSKSETLNKLLSNSQQYHNIFVHHNMECGDSPRRISNGLTEITWYLPCGNKNIDIFSQPVAVANLRGDIESFETQYAFLCQASAAVFVFLDKLDDLSRLSKKQHHQTQIFLVGNIGDKFPDVTFLNQVTKTLGLTKNNLLFKKNQENYANFIKRLREAVSKVISKTERKMSIEQMANIAHELRIWVDEDFPECQTAKQHADAITAEIQDTLTFKEEQLPLQGQIWKELTSLEKEEFRLQKLGSENIEKRKSDLKEKIDTLRQNQNSKDFSNAMKSFITALSLPQIERNYFLKWMQIYLDDVSRIKLSELRDLYEEKRKSSENKEEIKQLDQQLTNSSLGTEHFFREMGQMYEASRFLPETDPSRQQLKYLPELCAQLLMDGFPFELVDGDASNIPLQWVSDVLSQLNEIVSPKNKILVVTVLGVQSTGKSTLLNTMFGVQFAVSCGRCTRGAFMLLIKVHEEFKTVLNCDFIVIIDTEGLKSLEGAQLNKNRDYDNKLATLVVGMSNITITNLATENLTEMKDILQIVLHAFLRVREIDKKPKCIFVHQNVSSAAAHEKNTQAQDHLLKLLNELTQTIAQTDQKECKSFSDIMEYNPNTGNFFIPGLWNGNPPMAPVNVGYSEAVYELKKSLIQPMENVDFGAYSICKFQSCLKILWDAIKHENLLLSFRDSLETVAHNRLRTEFEDWDNKFINEVKQWITDAETKISNRKSNNLTKSETKKLVKALKKTATIMLSDGERKILDNLTQYFSQTEGLVHLVTGYRENYEKKVKKDRQGLEKLVNTRLQMAEDIALKRYYRQNYV